MGYKISVIMGIYNCSDTLPEAIDSLLNQTYKNFELIMCDDCSTDNTYDIAEVYADKYSDIVKLIRNSKNLGLNQTLNNCLAIATGDYIARMDGDDLSVADRFEKQVAFLDSHAEYAIVGTPMIMFDETGEWGRTGTIEIPQIKDFVFHAPVHCHASCMIRREAYMNVNGYTVDKRLLRYEDCDLWYKLYSAGYRGYNLQEPLYKMRDDRNAYKRRTPSSRLRAVYVQWIGFRMIKMPLKYYPYLLIEFIKSLILALMPESIYRRFHMKKRTEKY